MMSWPRDNLDPNLAAIFSKQHWSSCQNASLMKKVWVPTPRMHTLLRVLGVDDEEKKRKTPSLVHDKRGELFSSRRLPPRSS